MIDYGSEYDDAQGGEFALAVRALNRELPASDRLAALLRGLAAESPRFASPRQASAAPALRLLAYDGLITDILGEEIVAGQLSGSTLESLARLAAAQESLP